MWGQDKAMGVHLDISMWCISHLGTRLPSTKKMMSALSSKYADGDPTGQVRSLSEPTWAVINW